jgi:hypothetical protein
LIEDVVTWLSVGFFMAELGEKREKQIDELSGSDDSRRLEGLRKMLGVAGHEILGGGVRQDPRWPRADLLL